jgi:hypothetical protein
MNNIADLRVYRQKKAALEKKTFSFSRFVLFFFLIPSVLLFVGLVIGTVAYGIFCGMQGVIVWLTPAVGEWWAVSVGVGVFLAVVFWIIVLGIHLNETHDSFDKYRVRTPVSKLVHKLFGPLRRQR